MRTHGSQQAHPVCPTRDAQAPCLDELKDQMGDEGELLKRERRNEHPDKQRPVFRHRRQGTDAAWD